MCAWGQANAQGDLAPWQEEIQHKEAVHQCRVDLKFYGSLLEKSNFSYLTYPQLIGHSAAASSCSSIDGEWSLKYLSVETKWLVLERDRLAEILKLDPASQANITLPIAQCRAIANSFTSQIKTGANFPDVTFSQLGERAEVMRHCALRDPAMRVGYIPAQAFFLVLQRDLLAARLQQMGIPVPVEEDPNLQ